MIGLGRAVGETMIVVMAAGNTPVMDLNIFNGLRALSANIVVEMPEAVRDSTLYRMLFLAALDAVRGDLRRQHGGRDHPHEIPQAGVPAMRRDSGRQHASFRAGGGPLVWLMGAGLALAILMISGCCCW